MSTIEGYRSDRWSSRRRNNLRSRLSIVGVARIDFSRYVRNISLSPSSSLPLSHSLSPSFYVRGDIRIDHKVQEVLFFF